MLSVQKINQLFAILQQANPHPTTELNYSNAYTLLVAVVLSAQATDKGVNKATQHLFNEVDTPQKMVELGEEKLREKIKTIGLFNTKARNIIKLSQKLIDDYAGQVPNSRQDLESLAGVGRKSANVVLNTIFGQPTVAVDTHIFRVCNRTGLSPGKTPLAVEKGLIKNVPKKWLLDAHHWLVLHGRYICKAPRPLCGQCPIYDICGYDQKTV